MAHAVGRKQRPVTNPMTHTNASKYPLGSRQGTSDHEIQASHELLLSSKSRVITSSPRGSFGRTARIKNGRCKLTDSSCYRWYVAKSTIQCISRVVVCSRTGVTYVYDYWCVSSMWNIKDSLYPYSYLVLLHTGPNLQSELGELLDEHAM